MLVGWEVRLAFELLMEDYYTALGREYLSQGALRLICSAASQSKYFAQTFMLEF
jgi:hypothetical protein